MLLLVAIAFAVASGVAVLEFVSARALERIPSVATEKFPEIDRELLGKFSSFDSEPGWGTQPNRETQKGTGDHLPGEDVTTHLSPADGDVESLYPDRRGGGHYSPETNAATADVLADIVEARTITI